MPPKSNNRSKTGSKKVAANAAMADCVFPEDIMTCILSRLPVKSLARFKSVCKPWLKLFAAPDFVKSHYRQLSCDPENQNFMIYSLSEIYNVHTMSLFRIESEEKKSTVLDHPYPEIFFRMDFVGCCKGLICMACPPLGQGIVLWNPALKLFKFVRLSKAELGDPELVSLGFGYDEEEDDFKVVRIVCLRGRKLKVGIEVYSTKSDSWKTVKVRSQFKVLSTKSDAVVGGNPYWIAKVDKNVSEKSHIVWFDVKKMVCKVVISSNLELGEEGSVLPLMEWKGCLAAVMCNEISSKLGYGPIHVLVFDKDQKMWNMDSMFGPMEMIKMYRCLECSKSGKIVGVCFDGKLFVVDPKTRHVKVVEVEEAQMMSLQVHKYNESLVAINGMEPVVVKKEEVKEEDDEDQVDPTAGPSSADIAEFLKSYLKIHGGGSIGNYPLC